VKKVDLEKQIAKLAKTHQIEWVYLGGTKHEKWSLGGAQVMIPRHKEITENLTKKIIRDCQKIAAEKETRK